MRGQVSTLIVPQDYQWTERDDHRISLPQFSSDAVDQDLIDRATALLRTHEKALLFLGGKALRKSGLQAVSRIVAATGCDVLSERLFAHMGRGVENSLVEAGFQNLPNMRLLHCQNTGWSCWRGSRNRWPFSGIKTCRVGC